MADSPAQRSAESVPKQEAAAQPDPAFERWRRKAAWVVGYGLSPEDEAKRTEMKRLEQLDNEWSKCQKWKNDLMRNSPSVSRSSIQRVLQLSEYFLAYRSRCGIYDQAAGIRFWLWRHHTRSHPMRTVPPEARWRLQPATWNPSLSGWLYQ